MSTTEIAQVVRQFEEATHLSLRAGFQVVEIHAAHGYLLHEFLSPLSNQRQDRYGGSLENRMRFPLEVAKTVREIWPAHLPVLVRVSATDWATSGCWKPEETVRFCQELKKIGIDLIDCSSGGLVPGVKIPVGPSYQVPFAEKIRKETPLPTAAVGMITDAHQAEEILQSGGADAIFMAREFLRDPYWPLHAARLLHEKLAWPVQYDRAKPKD